MRPYAARSDKTANHVGADDESDPDETENAAFHVEDDMEEPCSGDEEDIDIGNVQLAKTVGAQCSICKQSFESRNSLHRHLTTTKHGPESSVNRRLPEP